MRLCDRPTSGHPARRPLSLARWVWRSYLRATVGPLVLLELALVLVYLVTGLVNHQRSIETLGRISWDELSRIVEREAGYVTEKLAGIEALTRVLRDEAGRALETPRNPSENERSAFALHADGRFTTTHDYGGAGVYFSGIIPFRADHLERIYRSARIDPLLRSLVDTHPAVVQAYLNTPESMCRIYPYMDMQEAFPPGMEITSYNFYYRADSVHNPSRSVVWTEAYLDPAGKGWIVSSIAPAYIDGRLEGVVGVDVTLSDVIEHILALDVPWDGYGFLVGRDGTAIALPQAAEKDWGIRELGQHSYQEAVLQDTFKPDTYNLFERKDLAGLARAVRTSSGSIQSLDLNGPRVAAWSTIPRTGWKLVVLVDTANILVSAHALRDQAVHIGSLMLAGMFTFYVVLLAFLLRRARRDSARLTDALIDIDRTVAAIGAGDRRHDHLSLDIVELNRTARGVVELGHDMARQMEELERVHADLRRATREAEQASDAKTAFLASMSHELRTPMNGVLGTVQLLERTELDRRQRRFLRMVGDSARSLLEVIGQVLDFSKIEAGQRAFVSEPLELMPWLEGLLEPFRRSAHARGVTVRLEAGESLRVHTDASGLRQVLTNLLDNAVKFTMQGEIVLSVEVPERIESRCRLAFEVRDTGIGIPAELHDQVFEAFEQAAGGRARPFDGTGLGLTIASRLVERLGGQLQLSSGPDRGSSFSFEFWVDEVDPTARATQILTEPLSEPTPAPLRRAREAEASPEPKYPARPKLEATPLCILVAEDNVLNQELIAAILEGEGYRVTIAANGAEAFRRFQENRFDVGLFDVHMPEMDGLSLTRWVRQTEDPSSRLPVIALTASATAEDERLCFEAGMDAFLTKPVDVEALRRALARFSSGRPVSAADA